MKKSVKEGDKMICFLDMDGVLVDFIGGLHRALEIPFDYSNYPYEPGRWDILGDIASRAKVSLSYPNLLCSTHFWESLSWMADGKEILELVERRFGEENVYLLTTPMPNPQSWTGKYLWAEKHLPQYKKRIIITHLQKSMFASENRVLIDDKDQNVDEFMAAGGNTILVPRVWNRLSLFQAVAYLKKNLQKDSVKEFSDDE